VPVRDTFDTAVTAVLSYEGGYVNDPNDPGGETNWGISKRAYPNLDIRNLTRDRAIEIYRRDYWDSLGCDGFPPLIAIALFDGAVNQGPVAAVRTLQRALGVSVDGVIGPQTLAAARAANGHALLADFLADRAVEYAGLPTFPRFGQGWMRRLFAVQQVCLQVTA